MIRLVKNKVEKFQQKNAKLSFFEKMFLLSPILIWFSYFPNFHIGRGSGMNLEFSLPLIFCVVLAILAIVEISKNWRENLPKLLSSNTIKLTFTFIALNWLSIFWSENQLRTFLTSGIWSVLWLIFSRLTLSKNFSKMLPILIKTLIFSSVAISTLAIFQVIFGAFSDFGLCGGCTAWGFGFVRPSVFAIEPQFLGSMLLAPILFLWQKFLNEKLEKIELSILILDLIAMYLTLSRGAIFSLIPAMFLVVVFSKSSSKSFRSGILSFVTIIALTFGAGMLIHAIFTELNPRISDGFYDSVSKSVNQLSLGKIKLPKLPQKELSSVEKSVENSAIQPQENPPQAPQNPPQKAVFDGYVERSTDERTKMSDLAIKTWLREPRTILFGVGSGGAGMAIWRTTGEISSSAEIVQNEFLSILLELGLFGLAILILIILDFFKKTTSNKLAWAILVAFLFQWNFFSGLPNALHIYLILAVTFVNFDKINDKNERSYSGD